MDIVAERRPRAANWAGWYTVAVCVLLYLLSSVDRQIINLLVGPIQAEFHIGDFEMGLLTGPAFGLCYALATFPLAWLADRMSRRILIFGCVLFWASAACASGLARTYDELFIARVLVGIGEAGLLPTSYVLIASRFEPHRLALPLSILTLGAVGGLGVAMGLGALLLEWGKAIHFPLIGVLPAWRSAFVISGLPGFFMAFLILTTPGERNITAREPTPNSEVRLGSFLRENRRVIAAMLVGFGLLQAVSAVVVAWFPTHLIRTYGWTVGQAGMAMALVVLMVASLGKLTAGTVVDAMVERGRQAVHFRYAILTSAIALPLTLAAAFAPTGVMAAVLVCGYFAGPYSSVGYGSAFVQAFTPPALRGRVSGLYLLACNLFAMSGPVVVGFVTDYLLEDRQRIGAAIACVSGPVMLISIVVLWRALPLVRTATAPAPHQTLEGTLA